jgi:hypothetical protein
MCESSVEPRLPFWVIRDTHQYANTAHAIRLLRARRKVVALAPDAPSLAKEIESRLFPTASALSKSF